MIGAQGLPEALTSALLLLFRSRRAWLRYSQRFSSFFSPAGLALRHQQGDAPVDQRDQHALVLAEIVPGCSRAVSSPPR